MRRGGGTIGPIFFEDAQGETVTVKQVSYVSTALEPFWEELGRRRSIGRHEEWLQQDEPTPHTAQSSLEWLQDSGGGSRGARGERCASKICRGDRQEVKRCGSHKAEQCDTATDKGTCDTKRVAMTWEKYLLIC